MKYCIRCAFVVLLSFGASCSAGPGDNTAPPSGSHGAIGAQKTVRHKTMLRVTLRLTENGVEVLSSVLADNTVNRRDPHRNSSTFFRVLDKDGNILVQRGFRLETTIRSETIDETGKMSGKQIPIDKPVFTLAIPLPDNAHSITLFESAPDSDGKVTVLGEFSP